MQILYDFAIWVTRYTPPIVDGFIGGVVAYITLRIVENRWQITRKKKNARMD
jgi:hypothetical protein